LKKVLPFRVKNFKKELYFAEFSHFLQLSSCENSSLPFRVFPVSQQKSFRTLTAAH